VAAELARMAMVRERHLGCLVGQPIQTQGKVNFESNSRGAVVNLSHYQSHGYPGEVAYKVGEMQMEKSRFLSLDFSRHCVCQDESLADFRTEILFNSTITTIFKDNFMKL